MNLMGNNRYELLFMDDDDHDDGNDNGDMNICSTRLQNTVVNKKKVKSSATKTIEKKATKTNNLTRNATTTTNNTIDNKDVTEILKQNKGHQQNSGGNQSIVKAKATFQSDQVEKENKSLNNNKNKNHLQQQQKKPNRNGSSLLEGAVNAKTITIVAHENKMNKQDGNQEERKQHQKIDTMQPPDTVCHNWISNNGENQGKQQQPKRNLNLYHQQRNNEALRAIGGDKAQNRYQMRQNKKPYADGKEQTQQRPRNFNSGDNRKRDLDRHVDSDESGSNFHIDDVKKLELATAPNIIDGHNGKRSNKITNINRKKDIVVSRNLENNRINNEQNDSNETYEKCEDMNSENNNEQQQQQQQLSNNKINEAEVKELTLDEWKAQQKQRAKPQFNIRKAGEGEDTTQWKKMIILNNNKKKEVESEEELDYDPAMYPQRVGRQQRILDIKFNFNDGRRMGGSGNGSSGGGGNGRSNNQRGGYARGPYNNQNNNDKSRKGNNNSRVNGNSSIGAAGGGNNKRPLPSAAFKVNDERQFPTLA